MELRLIPKPQIACKECGILFDPPSKRQIFCTTVCRSKYHARIYSEKWHAEHPKQDEYEYVCTRCNSSFKLPYKLFGVVLKNGVFCAACKPVMRRASYRLKTVKRQGAKTGIRISADDVAERFGAICALCNEPVDLSLSRISKMGATIDHIIPISKGGLDEWDNVQLAHWICNNRKGNKVSNA